MASKMDAGQITIDLSGKEYIMKTTPRAARMISNKLGAIQEIFPRLELVDYTAIEWVIVCALSWMPEKDRKGLPDKIFNAGMMNLVAPCSDYITLLANGGRPLDDIDDDDDGLDGEGGESGED